MEDSNDLNEFAVHHSEEAGKKIRRRLWNVFWILLIITGVEVTLGIFWKEMAGANKDSVWPVIKWLFISLTLVKAFYIVAEFMHLGGEKRNFTLTVMISYSFLLIYLIYMILAEAVYQ